MRGSGCCALSFYCFARGFFFFLFFYFLFVLSVFAWVLLFCFRCSYWFRHGPLVGVLFVVYFGLFFLFGLSDMFSFLLGCRSTSLWARVGLCRLFPSLAPRGFRVCSVFVIVYFGFGLAVVPGSCYFSRVVFSFVRFALPFGSVGRYAVVLWFFFLLGSVGSLSLGFFGLGFLFRWFLWEFLFLRLHCFVWGVFCSVSVVRAFLAAFWVVFFLLSLDVSLCVWWSGFLTPPRFLGFFPLLCFLLCGSCSIFVALFYVFVLPFVRLSWLFTLCVVFCGR